MTTEIHNWSHGATEHHGPDKPFVLGPFVLEPGEYGVKADMAVTVEHRVGHTPAVTETVTGPLHGEHRAQHLVELEPAKSTWEALPSADHFTITEPGIYRVVCAPGRGHIVLNQTN